MLRISTTERRRRLQARHLLTPAARTSDPAAVADAVVALHATDPATVYLSAWARMSSGSEADIADALYEHRTLLRLMGMRRTMFVVSREVAPLVQLSSAVSVAATQRKRLITHLQQAGVTDDVPRWLAEVCANTVAAVHRRGSATANDLVQDEPRLGTVLDLFPDKAYASPQRITSRVLTILGLEGQIIRGRPSGGWRGNRNEWWPTATWVAGGDTPAEAAEALAERLTAGAVDPAEVSRARSELAGRWLRAFGPAPLADLVWWTGWTLGQVRAAVAALPTSIVEVDGGEALVLADDVSGTPEQEPAVALLPALDPTPMGWSERNWYLGDHREPLFDRTGNIGPTIFWEGRVVGGWAQRADGEIRVRLLEDIGTAATDAVALRAAELSEWLGPLRVVPSFRTPLERELSV